MTLEMNLETSPARARISRRSESLFKKQSRLVARRTDRMFAVLMILQWQAGIVIALSVAPKLSPEICASAARRTVLKCLGLS